MPRLYDMLLAAQGSLIDRLFMGAYTKIAPDLLRAECFELSKDIVNACDSVSHSKPSSILSALPISRVPHEITWIEWVPHDHNKMVLNSKPVPKRMGCMLVSDKAGQQGAAIFAWAHSDELHDLTLNPVSLVFNWSEDGIPMKEILRMHFGIPIEKFAVTTPPRDKFEKELQSDPNWKQYAGDEREIDAFMELENRVCYIPNKYCIDLYKSNKSMHPPNGVWYRNFEADLVGELPFVEAFLLLLSTRNTIVERKRDDFSRLNKARSRNRKPPLKEFTTTSLKMNRVQANRGFIVSGTRESARAHVVMGHFKLRSSGVYWWSAHTRGFGNSVKRKAYKAEL